MGKRQKGRWRPSVQAEHSGPHAANCLAPAGGQVQGLAPNGLLVGRGASRASLVNQAEHVLCREGTGPGAGVQSWAVLGFGQVLLDHSARQLAFLPRAPPRLVLAQASGSHRHQAGRFAQHFFVRREGE